MVFLDEIPLRTRNESVRIMNVEYIRHAAPQLHLAPQSHLVLRLLFLPNVLSMELFSGIGESDSRMLDHPQCSGSHRSHAGEIFCDQ